MISSGIVNTPVIMHRNYFQSSWNKLDSLRHHELSLIQIYSETYKYDAQPVAHFVRVNQYKYNARTRSVFLVAATRHHTSQRFRVY